MSTTSNASALEQAVCNIEDFDAALNTSLGHVTEIRGGVGSVLDTLGTVDRAIDKVEELRDEVAAFGDDLSKLELVFSLMGLVSALRPFGRVGDRIVDAVKPVVNRLERTLDDAVQTLRDNPAKAALDRVVSSLETADGYLETVETEIAQQVENFEAVTSFAGRAAILADEPILALGTILEQPLAAIEAVNAVYNNPATPETDSVREFLAGFQRDVPSAEFRQLIAVEQAMNRVFDVLDDIRGPLNQIYNILKPIEPALNALSAISALTIDRAVDFITNTIGVEDLLRAAEERVLEQLPDVDVLDLFEAAYEQAANVLAEFDPATVLRSFDDDRDDPDGDGRTESGGAATPEVPDPFGIGQWVLEDLQARVLEVGFDTVNGVIQSQIGSVSTGGVGIAIELPANVRGGDEDDDLTAAFDPDGAGGLAPIPIEDLLMLGDANSNIITASGGENVLFGFEGNDTLIGGPDEDIAVFAGPLTQYQFNRNDEDGTVVIEHTSPISGVSLDGRDTLVGIERVTFLGGATGRVETLSIDALFDQVASVPAGGALDRSDEGDADNDGQIDTVYLFATGNASGITTLTGGGGDDQLTGTLGRDLLIGNAGNDIIDGFGGDDTINGGAGLDTYVFYDDGAGGGNPALLDLASPSPLSGAHFSISGVVSALLENVENVSVKDQREAFLFGDDADNVLSSADLRDVLDGRGGDDTLSGGGRNDVLIGGPGIDLLYGQGGNDDLVVADRAVPGGAQYYDGGAGNDRLVYSGDLGGQGGNEGRPFDQTFIQQARENFVLQRGRDQDSSGPIRLRGDARIERLSDDGQTVIATDRAVNIEGFVGSDFDDVLFGASGNQPAYHILDGAEGNDTIHARETSQIVRGGDGQDLIYAGTGGAAYGGDVNDTLDLSTIPDVRWRIVDVNGGNRQIQAYSAIDRQDLAADDAVTSFTVGSLTDGGFGTFIGSDFDDLFDITQGQDVVIRAGSGDDEIRVHVSGTGNSNGQSYTVAGETGNDTISVAHTADVDGGTGDDEIFVVAGSARILTEVDGGAGNDALFLLRATGSYTGGAGEDILSAHPVIPGAGLNVDLAAGTVTDIGSDDITATVAGFEIVIGSDRHADTLAGGEQTDILIGAGGRDWLEGRGGNDDLYGGAAPDTLYGGSGDDVLNGGSDNNTLDGGPGVDTASFDFGTPGGNRARFEFLATVADYSAVTADLVEGLATKTGGGSTRTTSMTGIENLTGTSLDDVLRGDGAGNVLIGGAGNDTLIGRGGDDRLVLVGDDSADGGAGDDYFVVGHGRSIIDGGAGSDTLEFDRSARVTYDAHQGTFEGVIDVAQPVWADTGTSEARSPAGNGPALTPQDVLEADPAFADSFDDASRVVPDTAAFQIAFSDVSMAISGRFSGIETILGGLRTVGGTDESERLDGNSQSETITGAGGDDTIDARAGSDVIDAGSGNDSVRAGIGFDTVTGGAGDDTLIGLDGFDNLSGGAGNDLIRGNNGFDHLRGEADDDTLEGGLGLDTLEGGTGRDLLNGNAGFDSLNGGTEADTLNGGAGADTLDGGAGGDRLFGGINHDLLIGGLGNDTLEGSNGIDTLEGGPGADMLFGNAGPDTLDGGPGNDTLNGGIARDTFIYSAGSGQDRITDFANNSDTVQIDAALLGTANPTANDLRSFAARDAEGFVVFDFGNGQTLTFVGIETVTTLLDDIVFA
ncbi:hypothetical protein [Cognatishimia sp. F0-27]|uniref:calcium-binding protein n=1 Tax=Cognatishimia sp. F0-27 TaxID=2816855 RepID=UPI001D0C020C|nr:hypothetical protein [Cognatishimia sp. F0-27]MCC1493899.1 hypothetical protein [Cognatishimia sp. F0-27]